MDDISPDAPMINALRSEIRTAINRVVQEYDVCDETVAGCLMAEASYWSVHQAMRDISDEDDDE